MKLELKDAARLQYDERGLVPAVVQDAASGRVLMLAYVNEEALNRTLETGLSHFYSRSRGKLWQKGETSGHIQRVESIRYDCDSDALLLTVRQEGAACHTGEYSCFYRTLAAALDGAGPAENKAGVLNELFEVIRERKRTLPEGSYTAKLFREGVDRILKKVGEESGEVIIAAKNAKPEEMSWEIADLIYHLWLLLAYYDLSPDIVYDRLRERRK